MRDRHRLLVVEDDPVIGPRFCERLRAYDLDPVLVTSVDEALAAIDRDRFCGAIVDLGIPSSAGGESIPENGHRLLRSLRERYPLRHANDVHVFFLIAMSATSTEQSSIMSAFKLSVDDFYIKSVGDSRAPNDLPLDEKIRRLIEKSGRSDHRSCARLTADAGSRPAAPNTLAIPGTLLDRRVEVSIGGRSLALETRHFLLLAELIAARFTKPGGWVPVSMLPGPGVYQKLSALGKSLRPHFSGGLDPIEKGDKKRRLHPDVRLGPIDVPVLRRNVTDEIRTSVAVLESLPPEFWPS